MKIKKLKISNYIGIEELDWDPGMINIIEGPKGTGKTSITEAIETALSNNKRRTEVISHGKDEALLFVETDEGLEVDRRLRTDKSDYLRLNGDMVAKSTESELRKFFRGDIFRPLDFIDLSIDEQTEIILSMIKMDYSEEEINDWFGEDVLKDINTSKHLLQILKDIEGKYYNERTEINREIRSLESQVKGIESELPPNYDGEKWKNEKVQEYYNKVSKARELNRKIEKAQTLKANFEDRVSAIEAEGKSKLGEVREKYQQQKEEIKELIELKENKIENKQKEIKQVEAQLLNDNDQVDDWLQKEIQILKTKAEQEKQENEEEAANRKYEIEKTIQYQKEKISAKKSELNGLDKQKELELKSIDKEVVRDVKAEREKLSEAEKLLKEKEMVEIEPLQEEADKVAEMKEYLSEWNRMVQIREGQLTQKKEYSDHLTELIEIARDKPSELIQKHEMPLEGISVDEEGLIRIDKTLLDGLSNGEKLEVAFQIALQRMGRLEIMCLDGFEKLNESEQEKILKMCRENEIQAFVTITKDTKNNERVIRSDSNDGN
jgi:exonuclease SbcC